MNFVAAASCNTQQAKIDAREKTLEMNPACLRKIKWDCWEYSWRGILSKAWEKNPAEALGKAGEPQLHLSVAPMEIRQCHEQQGAGVGAGGKDGANWQSQYINLRFSSVH